MDALAVCEGEHYECTKGALRALGVRVVRRESGKSVRMGVNDGVFRGPSAEELQRIAARRTDAEKRSWSRAVPGPTFTGVQWAMVEGVLRCGLTVGVRPEIGRPVREHVLPEIERLVDAARQLEPLGHGLDHPFWRELFPPPEGGVVREADSADTQAQDDAHASETAEGAAVEALRAHGWKRGVFTSTEHMLATLRAGGLSFPMVGLLREVHPTLYDVIAAAAAVLGVPFSERTHAQALSVVKRCADAHALIDRMQAHITQRETANVNRQAVKALPETGNFFSPDRQHERAALLGMTIVQRTPEEWAALHDPVIQAVREYLDDLRPPRESDRCRAVTSVPFVRMARVFDDFEAKVVEDAARRAPVTCYGAAGVQLGNPFTEDRESAEAHAADIATLRGELEETRRGRVRARKWSAWWKEAYERERAARKEAERQRDEAIADRDEAWEKHGRSTRT